MNLTTNKKTTMQKYVGYIEISTTIIWFVLATYATITNNKLIGDISYIIFFVSGVYSIIKIKLETDKEKSRTFKELFISCIEILIIIAFFSLSAYTSITRNQLALEISDIIFFAGTFYSSIKTKIEIDKEINKRNKDNITISSWKNIKVITPLLILIIVCIAFYVTKDSTYRNIFLGLLFFDIFSDYSRNPNKPDMKDTYRKQLELERSKPLEGLDNEEKEKEKIVEEVINHEGKKDFSNQVNDKKGNQVNNGDDKQDDKQNN